MIRLRSGVDAHQLDPEIPQSIEQPVQLGLIDEIRAKRGLTVVWDEPRALEGALEAAAQPAPDHDLVALP